MKIGPKRNLFLLEKTFHRTIMLEPMKILCVGAHPDDIELGIGSTLQKHVECGDIIKCLILTDGERNGKGYHIKSEIRREETINALNLLKVYDINFFNFEEIEIIPEIMKPIENCINQFNPDRIYTHSSHDRHQEHRNYFKIVQSIGRYTKEANFNHSFTDGTVGVRVSLYLEYQNQKVYFVRTTYIPISSGGTVNNGLISINLCYYTQSILQLGIDSTWDPPSSDFSHSTRFILDKNYNITISGIAKVQCVVNEVLVNETISYTLTFIVPLGLEDFANLDLQIYVIFYLYLSLIPLTPFILVYIFKPLFGIKIDEETQKRDEKFLNYLSKTVKEKQKDNPINDSE